VEAKRAFGESLASWTLFKRSLKTRREKIYKKQESVFQQRNKRGERTNHRYYKHVKEQKRGRGKGSCRRRVEGRHRCKARYGTSKKPPITAPAAISVMGEQRLQRICQTCEKKRVEGEVIGFCKKRQHLPEKLFQRKK